jgi:hypothetical protein
MGALFLCLRELVKEQGRGYDFTISENESTILLFGVGRDYEFINEEKESGGSGVMRSMPC